MSDDAIVVIDEPTTITVIEQPIVVTATEEPIVISIAEGDAALQAHAALRGVGGHIPEGGITQSLVVGLTASLGAIDQRLDLLEANPGSPSRYLFSLNSADSSYYYFGGASIAGEWKINRYNRNGLVKQSASIANNPGYAVLSAAWGDRISLTYGGV